MNKSEIRLLIQEKISQMSENAKKQESISVCNEVIALLEQYDFETLVSYTAFLDEIDTSNIHIWCEAHQKKVFLIPQTTEEIQIPEKCIILVPGRAFTVDGARLGRGSGFYDRLLEKSEYIATIGLAFKCQIVSAIPEEPWDKRVDFVVFERNTINNMNFWQKTKRFLEPLRASKKNLILHSIIHLTYQIGKVVPILLLILSQITEIEIKYFLYASIGYIIIGATLVRFLREYYWLRPGYGYLDWITKKYIKEFIQKNNLLYEALGTGRIIATVERGIYIWHVLLANGFIFFINTLVIGGFILMRITFIRGEYGLILLLLIISLLIWIIWNNNKALFWKKILKEKEGEHARRLVKIFMSKFEILQNKKVEIEQQWLKKNIQEQLDTANHRNIYLSYMYDLPYFGFLILIVGIFCLNYFGFVSMSSSFLVELIGIALLAQSMLLPYIDFIKDFTKDFVHIEKLWDFIDNTPAIEGYDTGKKFEFRKGDYELQDVEFSYHSQASVLENFSVKISGGKKTALVGRSGGGKTTIMKLLAGYMRPTGGKLMIDGQDITEIRLDSYYPHIGYLTQEPSVFDGTIEENLLYGARGKVSKEQLKRAIELSECQFIYELEDGIKTEIGERGVRLSGGQKQRLAIAKIFLKDPEIILLDEPTAALDSYSEEKVARAFEHLFVGRTVVVIAHRLQTVKSADDIIVIEKGKIVERGTHTQLLKLGKKYTGMVDLQSGIVKEDNEEKYAN